MNARRETAATHKHTLVDDKWRGQRHTTTTISSSLFYFFFVSVRSFCSLCFSKHQKKMKTVKTLNVWIRRQCNFEWARPIERASEKENEKKEFEHLYDIDENECVAAYCMWYTPHHNRYIPLFIFTLSTSKIDNFELRTINWLNTCIFAGIENVMIARKIVLANSVRTHALNQNFMSFVTSFWNVSIGKCLPFCHQRTRKNSIEK